MWITLLMLTSLKWNQNLPLHLRIQIPPIIQERQCAGWKRFLLCDSYFKYYENPLYSAFRFFINAIIWMLIFYFFNPILVSIWSMVLSCSLTSFYLAHFDVCCLSPRPFPLANEKCTKSQMKWKRTEVNPWLMSPLDVLYSSCFFIWQA